MKTIGIIDIGTNTILCLAGKFCKGIPEFITDERFHYRAGCRHDVQGKLSEGYKAGIKQALGNALDLLSGSCDEIKIVATEVLRKAIDGQQFAMDLGRELGVSIEIITPKREAELSYRGAIIGFENRNELVAVIDIGGGSTELAVGKGGDLMDWHSIGLGAVVLAEEFGYEKPLAIYIDAACRIIDGSDFQKLMSAGPNSIIAVGGSAVNLAILNAGLEKFPGFRLNFTKLSLTDLRQKLIELAGMSIERRRKVMAFESQRADIIVPGGAILLSFMTMFHIKTVLVSTFGLRHGLFLEQFGSFNA